MTPAEQLREGLARRRREGSRFAEAWTASWEAIDWPGPKYEDHDWKMALRATQPEWRLAFEHRSADALGARVAELRELREWGEHRRAERVAVVA